MAPNPEPLPSLPEQRVPGGNKLPSTSDGQSTESFQAGWPESLAPLQGVGESVTTSRPRSETFPDLAGPRAPSVPGYEVLGELGRGGMGVVYKARDPRLNRVVAVKMVLAGEHAGAAELRRFQAEAEAVARLQHPNIVAVYEVGEHEGRPFLVLEFVSGGSLAQQLAGMPMPSEQAAELIETLARAMHFAHQKGIIHRDLKPANILLAVSDASQERPAEQRFSEASLNGCVPKITDFGLAKRLEGNGGQTHSGAILGTPNYMAPEQAAGRTREVGPLADVYALGAILYDALTARPPFKGTSLLDTLEQVRTREPVPPSQLQPRVPRDLETICLKCLEKDPARRYASALELADDLGRFRAGEPIHARPASRLERLLKWAKRRPAAAALVTVSSLGSLLLLAVLTGSLVLIAQKQQRTEEALRSEEQAKDVAELAFRKSEESLRHEQEARQRERRTAYLRGVVLADREFLAGNITQVEKVLDECPQEFRAWEWGYLKRLCHLDLLTLRGHDKVVNSVVYSADGKRLLSASVDDTARLWDTASGKALRVLRGRGGHLRDAVFSPDGKRVAAVDIAVTVETSLGKAVLGGKVLVWDADSGELKHTWGVASGLPMALAFAPDGRRLAVASDDGLVYLLDAVTGKQALRLAGHKKTVECVAFSPDGRRVLSGGDDRLAIVWNAQTGEHLAALEGHVAAIRRVAFSPDGRLAASAAEDGTVKLWDLAARRERMTLVGHTALVTGVVFAPDGRRLASASADGSARIWNVATGRELLVLRGHRDALGRIAFAPDGTRVATASADHTVKVWEATTGVEPVVVAVQREPIPAVAFSPDGRLLAWVENTDKPQKAGSRVLLQERVSGQFLPIFATHDALIFGMAFSRDGKQLATASQDKTVRVWNLATSRATHTFTDFPGWATHVAFSPDGSDLAISGRFRVVFVIDLAHNRKRLVLKGHTGDVLTVAYSPNGKMLATASTDRTVRLWNSADGRSLLTLNGHEGEVNAATFGPDGKVLASAGEDRTVRLWDVADGKQRRVLRGHSNRVVTVVFNPDGKRLASAGRDKSVRLWDAVSGEEVLTLRGHGDWVRDVSFSPDGKTLASCSLDRTVRLWQPEPRPRSAQETHKALLLWHNREMLAAMLARQWDALAFHADRLLQTYPNNGGLYFMRGRADTGRRRWQEAVADFTRAIELGGAVWNSYAGRANACSELGRWKEAAADNAAAFRTGATDFQVWRRQAVVLLMLDDDAGYKKIVAELLQRFSSTNDAERIRQILWTALLHPNAGIKPAAALALAEQIIAKHPRRQDCLALLALALFRAGRTEDALRRLDELLKARGKNVEPQELLLLALFQRRLGKEKEADATLELAARASREFADLAARDDRDDWLGWLYFAEAEVLRREARKE